MTGVVAEYDAGTCERLIGSVNPIIIGGCGRSGTTLLLSMLSCHPHIWSIPWETNAFLRPEDGGPPAGDHAYFHMIAGALYSASIPPTCTRWCEKTPRNVKNFGHILECYGAEARLIHLVRDGRDVVTSVHPQRPDRYWVSPQRWVNDVTAGLQFQSHPQVLTVRYEDLVGDPRTTLHTVCAFIDEEYSPRFDEYPASAKFHTSSAWFHPATRVGTASVARWRDAQHTAIIQDLLADDRAQTLLKEFGYLGG